MSFLGHLGGRNFAVEGCDVVRIEVLPCSIDSYGSWELIPSKEVSDPLFEPRKGQMLQTCLARVV